jgi:hypothetical protein
MNIFKNTILQNFFNTIKKKIIDYKKRQQQKKLLNKIRKADFYIYD